MLEFLFIEMVAYGVDKHSEPAAAANKITSSMDAIPPSVNRSHGCLLF